MRVALGLVVGGDLRVEAGRELLEAGGGAVLEGRGRADIGQVVEVGHGAHPAGVGGDVAEPPAGDAEKVLEKPEMTMVRSLMPGSVAGEMWRAPS